MVRLAVIPGDGIGPEVAAEALPLLEWARSRGRDLAWDLQPWGAERFLATGEALPDEAFEAIRDGHDAVLFGAVGDPRIPDNRHAEAILLRLRQELELAVNYRPCFPAADALVPLKSVKAGDIRIEVFRENTEGPYCLRGRSGDGFAVDEAHHSGPAVERLLEAAFARAEAARRPLTLAHKANVLKHGHGLWMRRFQACRAAHPAVEASALHADALLCALVQRPSAFGIIAGDNFIGDLVSDLTAAFMGGMGLAPSLSYAPHKPFRCSALTEPVHGSAPDLAGMGKANPGGMILSAALLFRHLGWEEEAAAIEASVTSALRAGAATADLGGSLTTAEMGAALRANLAGLR
ncbi:MAG TPA: isocitrate/isopropylmalate family dehydrogenase [Holophagaceae bacterium]|nr:isocitrate/isopropylmalate family dehydrogenase [Holophagaceae bacterium]